MSLLKVCLPWISILSKIYKYRTIPTKIQVQNVSQTNANSYGSPFVMKENPFEIKENIIPGDIDVELVPSNPFRANPSYFKQSELASEKFGSLLNEFCINNLKEKKTGKGDNECNWLLKYIVDIITQMRKEHDRLSFKVQLLNQENRLFRDEINNLKFNKRFS